MMEIKRELFSETALTEAIDAFSHLCVITVLESATGWNLVFENCKYGCRLTEKEFENYLIGLENT